MTRIKTDFHGFYFFRHLSGRWGNLKIVLIEVGLAVFMWGVFALTLEGNWEHTMMHGLLPALMLVLYFVFRISYFVFRNA